MPSFFNNGRTLGIVTIGFSVVCAIASYSTLANLANADDNALKNGYSHELDALRREMVGYLKLSKLGVLVGGIAVALDWCMNRRQPIANLQPNARPT